MDFSIEQITGIINRKEPLPTAFTQAIQVVAEQSNDRGIYALTLAELFEQLHVLTDHNDIDDNYIIKQESLYRIVSVLDRHGLSMIPISVPRNLCLSNFIYLLRKPDLALDPDIAALQEILTKRPTQYTNSQLDTIQKAKRKIHNYNIMVRVFETIGVAQTRNLDTNQRTFLQGMINEMELPHDGIRYIRSLYSYICDYGAYAYTYEDPRFFLKFMDETATAQIIDIVAHSLSRSQIRINIDPKYPFAKQLQERHHFYAPHANTSVIVVPTNTKRLPIAARPLSALNIRQKMVRFREDKARFLSRLTKKTKQIYLDYRQGYSQDFINKISILTSNSDQELAKDLNKLQQQLQKDQEVRLLLPNDSANCVIVYTKNSIESRQYIEENVATFTTEETSTKKAPATTSSKAKTKAKSNKSKTTLAKYDLPDNEAILATDDPLNSMIKARGQLALQKKMRSIDQIQQQLSEAKVDRRGTTDTTTKKGRGSKAKTGAISANLASSALTSTTAVPLNTPNKSFYANTFQAQRQFELEPSLEDCADQMQEIMHGYIDPRNFVQIENLLVKRKYTNQKYWTSASEFTEGYEFHLGAYTWDKLNHFMHNYLMYTLTSQRLQPNIELDYHNHLEMFVNTPPRQLDRLNLINSYEFILMKMFANPDDLSLQRLFDLEVHNPFLLVKANPIPFIFYHSLYLFDKHLENPATHFNNEFFYMSIFVKEPYAINIYLSRIIHKYGDRLIDIPKEFYTLIALQMLLFPVAKNISDSYELLSFLSRISLKKQSLKQVILLRTFTHKIYKLIHEEPSLHDTRLLLVKEVSEQALSQQAPQATLAEPSFMQKHPRYFNKEDKNAREVNKTSESIDAIDAIDASTFTNSSSHIQNAQDQEILAQSSADLVITNVVAAPKAITPQNVLKASDLLNTDASEKGKQAKESQAKVIHTNAKTTNSSLLDLEQAARSQANVIGNIADITNKSDLAQAKANTLTTAPKQSNNAQELSAHEKSWLAPNKNHTATLLHELDPHDEKVQELLKAEALDNGSTLEDAQNTEESSTLETPELNPFFIGDKDSNFTNDTPFEHEELSPLLKEYVNPLLKRILCNDHSSVYSFTNTIDFNRDLFFILNKIRNDQESQEVFIEQLPHNRFIIDSFIYEKGDQKHTELKQFALKTTDAYHLGFVTGIETKVMYELSCILQQNLQVQLVPSFFSNGNAENFSRLRNKFNHICMLEIPEPFLSKQNFSGYTDFLFSLYCSYLILEFMFALIPLSDKQGLITLLVKEVSYIHNINSNAECIRFAYEYIDHAMKIIELEGPISESDIFDKAHRLLGTILLNRGPKRLQLLMTMAFHYELEKTYVKELVKEQYEKIKKELRFIDDLLRIKYNRAWQGSSNFFNISSELTPSAIELDMEKIKDKIQESDEVQDIIMKLRLQEEQKRNQMFNGEDAANENSIANQYLNDSSSDVTTQIPMYGDDPFLQGAMQGTKAIEEKNALRQQSHQGVLAEATARAQAQVPNQTNEKGELVSNSTHPVNCKLDVKSRALIEAIAIQGTDSMDLNEFKGLCASHRFISANAAIEMLNEYAFEEYDESVVDAYEDEGIVEINTEILSEIYQTCLSLKKG